MEAHYLLTMTDIFVVTWWEVMLDLLLKKSSFGKCLLLFCILWANVSSNKTFMTAEFNICIFSRMHNSPVFHAKDSDSGEI